MNRLFGTAEADGVVTSAELQGLQTIVADAATFHMPADIENLADKVINGDLDVAIFSLVADPDTGSKTPMLASPTSRDTTAIDNGSARDALESLKTVASSLVAA